MEQRTTRHLLSDSDSYSHVGHSIGPVQSSDPIVWGGSAPVVLNRANDVQPVGDSAYPDLKSLEALGLHPDQCLYLVIGFKAGNQLA
jgi:hypothetical protein